MDAFTFLFTPSPSTPSHFFTKSSLVLFGDDVKKLFYHDEGAKVLPLSSSLLFEIASNTSLEKKAFFFFFSLAKWGSLCKGIKHEWREICEYLYTLYHPLPWLTIPNAMGSCFSTVRLTLWKYPLLHMVIQGILGGSSFCYLLFVVVKAEKGIKEAVWWNAVHNWIQNNNKKGWNVKH